MRADRPKEIEQRPVIKMDIANNTIYTSVQSRQCVV